MFYKKLLTYNFVLFLLLLALMPATAKGQLLDSAALAEAYEFRSLREALLEPENVYRLRLRRDRLTAFPEEIFFFKNLNALDLQNNRIKEIPPEIQSLEYLQELNMGRNEIKAIPVELTTLQHLKVLSLNRNQIDVLPPEMGNMYSLQVLDLWGTKVVKFPVEMGRLRHTIKTIDMRVISMCREQQDAIAQMFPGVEMLMSSPCVCE